MSASWCNKEENLLVQEDVGADNTAGIGKESEGADSESTTILGRVITLG